MTTIKIKNYSLVVFKAKRVSTKPLFESYEMAKLLGYSQASSLRKQTLSDWKDMIEGVHYEMVHDVPILRRYEKEHEDAGNGTLRLVSSTRGRLFFTPEGMMFILNRTSKPCEDLRSALERKGYFKGVFGAVVIKDENVNQFIFGTPCRRCKRPLDESRDCPCTPAPKIKIVSKAPPEVQVRPSMTREDRMFEYGVMQKLLEQLERLTDLQLRGLAITAAETALGRELKDLRLVEGVKTIFGAVVPAPPKKTAPQTKLTVQIEEGPFFGADDFFSMTRIGEMAGGYSAKSAGSAANVIAAQLSLTPEQIRNKQLPINQIEMRPDSSTGKKRSMVRFHTKFANRVIRELRGNPQFEPSAFTPGVSTLEGFGSGTQPLLSRGPFEDDVTPPHHS